MKTLRFALTVAVLACVHTTPAPDPGAWITSDSSQYSPIAHFRAYARIGSSTIQIAIDSGSLIVPGEPVPDAPTLMSELYLTAILAIPDSGSFAVVRAAHGNSPGDRRGWRPIARSDSILIGPELHYGEHARFGPVNLTLPIQDLGPGPAWIVYAITGNTVELSPPLSPGGPIVRRDHPGGVRVYACSDRDIHDEVDPTRSASLRRAYGIAC
jgi:hypothetical protein